MEEMVTRIIAVQNLQKYVGRDLSEIAPLFGITTFRDGKQNKGWKGQTLERLAGLTNNSKRAPNGLDFELKSAAFYQVRGKWKPRETFAITMINPAELREAPFYESQCWCKLKSLIFCAVSWHGPHSPNAKLLKVQSFDFTKDKQLLDEIEADYEFIRQKLITKGFEALTGRDGEWIQARTKGSGHGSTTRAFYARKKLISKIIDL
jgi:DNA mismatch repair protein MutH